MINRAVVVPHPPLLVPELAPGVVEQTKPVRTACLAAAAELAEVATDWIAVGAAEVAGAVEPGTRGSFRGFGVDVPVSLSDESDEASGTETGDLPLPVLVAGWLRARAGARSVRAELLSSSAGLAECVDFGERLAGETGDFGLLVLGDGSTRHDTAPPPWPDERAAGFDAKIAAALAGADPEALLTIDTELAAELHVGGQVPWWVLAGVARTWPRRRGRLVYSGAPIGVAYHVAVWDRE
jgi:hypothetical protein